GWGGGERVPGVGVLSGRGREGSELTGGRVEGVAELLPAEPPALREPMSAWHDKYRAMLTGDGFERFAGSIPSLGFVRVVPARVATWDHREASRRGAGSAAT